MQGATKDEVDAKLGTILQSADPPHSDAEVIEMLAESGFEEPLGFFSSLLWGAWLCRRRGD
jgi:tRNA (cmo5U34)-methyltransferase